MSQKIIIILGVLIIVLGGGYYLTKNLNNGQLAKEAEAASLWVEVISSGASFIDEKGGTHDLHTGDEILVGSTIVTDITGRVVIHLPEGSVLRVDENSKLILNKAEFSSKDEGIVVETTLVVGRVWSKVIALVTPESRWEVKTSNAVATVRGTSFGVGFKDGKSRIVGGEHKIKVNPIDPKTQKVIDKAEREIDAGKFIEIKDDQIDSISLKPESLSAPVALSGAPRDVLDWNLRNEVADRDINQKIEIIKGEGLNDKETRKVLRKETEILKGKISALKVQKLTDEEIKQEVKKENIGDFKKRLIEQIEEIKQEGGEFIPTENTNETSSGSNVETGTIREEVSTAKPVKLMIGGITTSVNDGSRTSLKATLIFSDGTRKDVTGVVIWKINGFVGTMEKNVFVAKIRDEDSEVPEVKGSIDATLQSGDATFVSDLINFVVKPVFEETIPQG